MNQTINEVSNTLAIPASTEGSTKNYYRNNDERPRFSLRLTPQSFKMIQRISKVFNEDYSQAVDRICYQLSLAEPSYVKPVLSYTTYADEDAREIIEAVCNSITALREERLHRPVQRTKPTTAAEVAALAQVVTQELHHAA